MFNAPGSSVQSGAPSTSTQSGTGASAGMGPNPFNAPNAPQTAFNPAPTPQQQAPVPSPSGLPDQRTPPTPSPQDSVIPQRNAGGEGGSSLDKYMKKADNSPDNKGKPNAPAAPTPANPFAFTNKEYGELMKNQNFVGEIGADVMTAIQQGDGNALATLINTAVANGSSMGAHLSTQIAQRGVDYNLNNFRDNGLQDVLKNHSFQQEWNNAEGSDADILRHPAVAPMVEQQMNNFRSQYPDASPREITDATRKYFNEFASAFSDSASQNEQPSQPAANTMGGFFNS